MISRPFSFKERSPFNSHFFCQIFFGRFDQNRAIGPNDGGYTAKTMVEGLDIFARLFIEVDVNPTIRDLVFIEKQASAA